MEWYGTGLVRDRIKATNAFVALIYLTKLSKPWFTEPLDMPVETLYDWQYAKHQLC